MKKNKKGKYYHLISGILILFIGLTGLPDPASGSVFNRTQVTVHATITNAISSASNGDLIEAGIGVYNEMVIIKNFTSLTLRSVMWRSNGDNTNTVIDGNGTLTNGIYISNSSYIQIEGFKITNSLESVVFFDIDVTYSRIAHCNIAGSINEEGIYAIRAGSIRNNTIISNKIYNNKNGIYYRGGRYCSIIGNIIENNNQEGIRLRNNSSRDYIIFKNIINNNRRGIRIRDAYNSIINDNYVAHNSREGILIDSGSRNFVITNNVICSNDWHGICFNNNNVDNNKIRNNRIFANQLLGIVIVDGDDNIIDNNNVIFNNNIGGILLIASLNINAPTGNLIMHNSIYSNLSGISIVSNGSTNNIITRNNIIDNTINFVNLTGSPVKITNNWWGTTKAPVIGSKFSNHNNYSNFTPYRLFGPFDLSTGADTDSMPAIQILGTTVVDMTNITLIWIKPTDTSDFVRYFVYESSNMGYTNLTGSNVIAEISDENTTTYSKIVPLGITNYYYVTSLDGNSPYTNESWYSPETSSLATPPPAMPVITSATINGPTIDITWTDVSNETSYTLFRNTTNDTITAEAIIGLSINVVNYIDTNAPFNTNSYYWIKAYNMFGGSEFSAVASNILIARVFNRNSGLIYPDIASALNVADNGNLLEAAEYVFNEPMIISGFTNLVFRSIEWTNSQDNVNTIIDGTGLSNGIFISNSENCTIEGFSIKNAVIGVLIKSPFTSIKHCNIFSNTLNGINMPDGKSRDNTVLSNKIHANTNGIYIDKGDRNKVLNNNIYNNALCGIYLISTKRNGSVDDTIISDNIIYDNSDRGISITSTTNGGKKDNVIGTIVSDNKIYNNKEGIYIFSIGDSKVNTTYITGNKVTNNTGVGILLNNYNDNNAATTVTNNYIANNDAGGITMFGNRKNIYNNTVYSNRGAGIIVSDGEQNNILGNIVYANRAPYGIGIAIVNGIRNDVKFGNIYNNIGPGILIAEASTNNYIELNSIYSNGSGLSYSNNSFDNRIRKNNIFDNTGNNIINYTVNFENIFNNWWGTTIASAIASKISGNGGYSNFTPYRLFGEFDITPGADTDRAGPIAFAYTLTNNQTNITLVWTIPAETNDFARYFVYTNSEPGTTNLTKNNVAWQTTDLYNTTFTDVVTSGTMYYYITSLDTNSPYTNESWYSIEANSSGIIPAITTPTNIYTEPRNNGMMVYWANASNETSYTLFRNTVNDPNTASAIAYIPGEAGAEGSANYLDETAEYDTVYYYWVKAFNSFTAKESSYSTNTVTMLITRPVLSYRILPVGANTNKIVLTWSSVTAASGYVITNILLSGMNINTFFTQISSGTTSITDSFYYTNTPRIRYLIYATNQFGRSAAVNITFKIKQQPNKPKWVSVIAAGTTVKLKWEFLPFTTGYTLFRSTDINTTNVLAGLPFNITNYIDTGLTPGTTYYYWLRVNNGLGFSPYASTNITTLKGFESILSGVRIGPTTIFGMNKRLYFEKVTEETEVAIYDIKGRKLWSKKAAECQKTPDQNYYYVDETVINSLVDGLYIIVFTAPDNEPVVKKFNRISRERK